jgi:hypothetical protein
MIFTLIVGRVTDSPLEQFCDSFFPVFRFKHGPSSPHNLSSVPVLVTLKPDDTHPACKGTYDEINEWHGPKPEEILEKWDKEDQDQATYRSCKHPSHRLVGGA